MLMYGVWKTPAMSLLFLSLLFLTPFRISQLLTSPTSNLLKAVIQLYQIEFRPTFSWTQRSKVLCFHPYYMSTDDVVEHEAMKTINHTRIHLHRPAHWH